MCSFLSGGVALRIITHKKWYLHGIDVLDGNSYVFTPQVRRVSKEMLGEDCCDIYLNATYCDAALNYTMSEQALAEWLLWKLLFDLRVISCDRVVATLWK